jgi:hypothetical protein
MFGGGQTMAGGPGGFGGPANNPEAGGQAMGAKRIGGMEAPAQSGGWGGQGLAAGMESPGLMGLLGAGMGMMQASQQGNFGDAIGGGMGGLLGGAMTANQAKQSRLSDERFNGLLSGAMGPAQNQFGTTPGQQAAPPMTGSPAQPPAAQGPSPASMPPTTAGGSGISVTELPAPTAAAPSSPRPAGPPPLPMSRPGVTPQVASAIGAPMTTAQPSPYSGMLFEAHKNNPGIGGPRMPMASLGGPRMPMPGIQPAGGMPNAYQPQMGNIDPGMSQPLGWRGSIDPGMWRRF